MNLEQLIGMACFIWQMFLIMLLSIFSQTLYLTKLMIGTHFGWMILLKPKLNKKKAFKLGSYYKIY